MKRAFVYTNKTENEGKLVAVEDTFKDFKKSIAFEFNLEAENLKLYSLNGCEINDTRVIRDDEKIYLSFKSENGSKGCDTFDSFETLHISDGAENGSVSKKGVVSDWITLNVGGKHFTTSRSTLLVKEPLSMLARMFADDNNVYLMNPSAKDKLGAYLIDRSPEYFEPILNYLRHGEVILDKNVNPKGVLEEAVFYGIDSMIPQLRELIEESTSQSGRNQSLNRMDVIRLIMMTPTESELRFQGVNLAGADLNRLDLRHINFKYACLARCNLSGANLSHCCLERADLSHANLEGAQLLGVKALCANMEGALLIGCNMEDPAGSKAVMEGVNLKGADLEGSNMAGVNLRVATLKNANLQNCDLRAAVLAGADLESCDLSGSDLHEANLRGANLKDAMFELMLTPLHMSQTIR
ncbi:BTB/POZ domain-containing protein KCTD9 [Pararge aegeria]|uniref:Jg14124 protein n=3 Tax=Pararge aegeria TaxID=116150 RepID=A0A8S4RVE6_9NEOP|nr:BTB/POZ domain-containing protein KCTD9 [Pararge aegeria]CAH2242588.1 jg14124 [Pararge aegeria aegeria]